MNDAWLVVPIETDPASCKFLLNSSPSNFVHERDEGDSDLVSCRDHVIEPQVRV